MIILRVNFFNENLLLDYNQTVLIWRNFLFQFDLNLSHSLFFISFWIINQRIENFYQNSFWKRWKVSTPKRFMHRSTSWWQIWKVYQFSKVAPIADMDYRSLNDIITSKISQSNENKSFVCFCSKFAFKLLYQIYRSIKIALISNRVGIFFFQRNYFTSQQRSSN